MGNIIDAEIKAGILNEVIKIAGALVEEIKISVSPEGLSIKAVDPAHVALVEINLTPKAFGNGKFNVTTGDIGISIIKIQEILKLASPDTVIGIKHNESKNRLIFSIGNLRRSMALINTGDMIDPKIPKVNLPATVEIGTEELLNAIIAANSVSDRIKLTASPERFELLAEGTTDEVILNVEKEKLGSLDAKEEVKSSYSLDYIFNFVKATISDSVLIRLNTDHPVCIEFDIAKSKVGDKIEYNGHVKYLLAPRIEKD